MPSSPSSSSQTPRPDRVTIGATVPPVGVPPTDAEMAAAPEKAREIAATIRARHPRLRRDEGKTSAGGPLWITLTVVALRIIIGGVFIASGFAKAIDPWGSVYKIGEYLTNWGLTVPHSLTVAGAVGLSTLEFLCGAMLLLGCYRRSIVIILGLIMVGMLPLSLYIYIANPVADCGCFGDLWVISNSATFWKNVAITAGIVFLLIYNRRVRCAVSPYVQWLPLTLSVAYPLLLSLDGYNVQPLLDFRQYALGRSLTEGDADDATIDESASYRFIYEKEGEKRVFTVDNLPDSTWTYIDRETVNDASVARREDPFAIYDTEGDDIAESVIADEGPEVLVCIPSLSAVNMSYTYYLNELYALLDRHGVPMVGVIGGGEKDLAIWADLSMAEYPLFNGDPLQIKELVRGRAGIVVLHDGRVTAKSAAGPFLARMEAADAFTRDDLSILDETPNYSSRLKWLTWAYVLSLVAVIAVNNGVLAVLTLWRKRMVKKMRGRGDNHRNNS